MPKDNYLPIEAPSKEATIDFLNLELSVRIYVDGDKLRLEVTQGEDEEDYAPRLEQFEFQLNPLC